MFESVCLKVVWIQFFSLKYTWPDFFFFFQMCYSPQNHTETNKRKAALQIELINRRLSLGTHFTAATYLLGRIMLLQLVIIKTTVCFVFFFFSIYYLLLFVFINLTDLLERTQHYNLSPKWWRRYYRPQTKVYQITGSVFLCYSLK